MAHLYCNNYERKWVILQVWLNSLIWISDAKRSVILPEGRKDKIFLWKMGFLFVGCVAAQLLLLGKPTSARQVKKWCPFVCDKDRKKRRNHANVDSHGLAGELHYSYANRRKREGVMVEWNRDGQIMSWYMRTGQNKYYIILPFFILWVEKYRLKYFYTKVDIFREVWVGEKIIWGILIFAIFMKDFLVWFYGVGLGIYNIRGV